ncbi:hypothetical protein [Thalassobacillus sp. C254]|uniref:hypothetical protein n=1 Tax=Thalassobacillus sp. C254 TaxID=1225341 RepID=UPI0018DDACFD|nr:hypothetical protein [Thalassobacillus sp. C254]
MNTAVSTISVSMVINVAILFLYVKGLAFFGESFITVDELKLITPFVFLLRKYK